MAFSWLHWSTHAELVHDGDPAPVTSKRVASGSSSMPGSWSFAAVPNNSSSGIIEDDNLVREIEETQNGTGSFETGISPFSQRTVAPMDIMMTEESTERIVEGDDADVVHGYANEYRNAVRTASVLQYEETYHDAMTSVEQSDEEEMHDVDMTDSSLVAISSDDIAESDTVDETGSMSLSESEGSTEYEQAQYANTVRADSTAMTERRASAVGNDMVDSPVSSVTAAGLREAKVRSIGNNGVVPTRQQLKPKAYLSAAIVVDSSDEGGSSRARSTENDSRRSSMSPDMSGGAGNPGPSDTYTKPSASLRFHYELHERALTLLSRLPAALTKNFDSRRRYWLVVFPSLPPPKYEPRKIGAYNVKDVIWMQGHLKTTMRTVREKYCLTMMLNDIVLLLGGNEVLADEIQTQEMDFFNDKMVVFVAKLKAQFKGGQVQGRDLLEGLIPPVSDLEARGPAGTSTKVASGFKVGEVVDLTA